MHQRFFGESRDIAKRQIMKWLAPNVRWSAHPMWYGNRKAKPHVPNFLNCYAAAIDVAIVDGGDSANPDALLEATLGCREHLFLDPDTGLGERIRRRYRTHMDYDHFIQIVRAPLRRGMLTLIYDEGNAKGGKMDSFTQAIQRKVDRLHRNKDVHAVGYLAELALKVCFIWASTNCEVVTDATRNLQYASGFPDWRFVDDGCGHVGPGGGQRALHVDDQVAQP